jgi:hypothetical protein
MSLKTKQQKSNTAMGKKKNKARLNHVDKQMDDNF